jgi:FixJ family two-component response regulator
MRHDQLGHRAMNQIRPLVIIIDDDRTVREALQGLLETIDLDVRLFASPEAFLKGGEVDRSACIVMDIRLPGLGGFDVQAELARQGSRLPIIFITGYGDVRMSVRAMKAGAVDFLPKPFRDQDMIDAVTAAIERDRERRAAGSANADIRDRHASLSPREKQVMALVTTGKMNKQVAFDLGLSEITVKTYRGAVMQKMAAGTFADLVRMADALALRGSS